MITDNSLMPCLIWYYDNGKCSNEISKYIEDNRDVLEEEIKNQKK